MSEENKKKPMGIFNIVTKGEKKFWNRIGSAWTNRDGSFNLVFESFPVVSDPQIQVRALAEKEENFG